MTRTNLATVFEEQAAPPLLKPEEYRALLERLLSEGKGYGKTKEVAAYLLTNIRLVTETEGKEIEQDVEVKPIYVIMDIALRTNEYARLLEMQEIAKEYARRTIGIGDINGPDFKGPGVWTTGKAVFEQDYIRREGPNEYGLRTNLYDPNPEAFRVCLQPETQFAIPVAWGTYPIAKGGTVAVREQDVPALAQALQDIRDGKASIIEALYERTRSGEFVARFDIYGMDPGFLEDNYEPVLLKESTMEIAARFTPPVEATAAAPKRSRPPLHRKAEELLERYPFSELPKDGAVFWCKGAEIGDPDARKTFGQNEELALGFLKVQNYFREGSHSELLDTIDRYDRGRRWYLLPPIGTEFSYFEQKEFWREISNRFARAARGTIHVAASGGYARSGFRIFEYQTLMENDDVSHAQIIKGRPTPARLWPYVDTLKGTFERTATLMQNHKRDRDASRTVCLSMLFNKNLRTLPKALWAERQKQEWFDSSLSALMAHFEERPLRRSFQGHGFYYYDRSVSDFMDAKTRFIGEIIFSLREADRLKRCLEAGDASAAALLKGEKRRLAEALRIAGEYPEILYFDEPYTELEWRRAGYPRLRSDYSLPGPLRPALTQQAGSLMLQTDESMSLEEKNRIWGRFSHYDLARRKDIDDIPADQLGQPGEMDDYVRERLAALPRGIQRRL